MIPFLILVKLGSAQVLKFFFLFISSRASPSFFVASIYKQMAIPTANEKNI